MWFRRRLLFGALPPSGPSGLSVAIVSSTALTLTWTDNSSNETSFRVERSTDGVTYAEIASTAFNVTTYADTGLTPATLYYYRVRAKNSSGNSLYSAVASATTYRTDVQNYFTSGSIVDATERSAVSTLIVGLAAAGILTKFDRLWLVSTTSSAAALLDFMALGSMTNHGATFTANGWDCATSAYLDTSYIPSANAVNLTNTSGSMGVNCYSGTAGTAKDLMGSLTSTKEIAIHSATSAGNILWSAYMLDSGSTLRGTYTENTTTELLGFRSVSRTSSTVCTIFDEGFNINSSNASNSSTVAQNNITLFLGCRNNAATADNFSNSVINFAFIGAGLSNAEMITLDNLQDTYQSALNRNSYRASSNTYFSNAGITSGTEKHFANRAIAAMKAYNIYLTQSRIFLVSPTSFAASLCDVKAPATPSTAVNMSSANWSATAGLMFDGISTYVRTGVTPSGASMTTGSGHGSIYVDPTTALNDGTVPLGCLHSDAANGFFLTWGVGN